MKIGINLSIICGGPKDPAGAVDNILMESSGYFLMEDGSYILME